MNLNEIPAWNEIESQPWFAELTPEEKQQSLTKWQGDMMSFAKDPKEKFAVAATSKAKARSFFGEEMPDDPIADALQRRQKDLEDIGSRYDAFSKGELEEDDEEVLTLNDTLKGNTPYSVIKGRLFVSPQLVWDKAAYEKVVNEAPVDEDERVLAMSAYDGSKERAAEGVVNSLGYTDEAFRDFAAKGFKEGKSNAAILDEWKANNKLPDGIFGTLRGVGRQAYFGLRSGLSGLERAMGGLGGFFGSESAQKYAEESGKEAQSYMQRTLGEGPEFIGELTSGAVSIIPTIAAGAAASVISEGAALPAAASITAGAIQSAGATQAETYEFYRNQGLDHANALAESRVDGLVSGLITGAITHYAGKLGDKIGLGKGIEGLFSGPASKIASKLTQREISESLKAGAKAVGGSFLQEGSEELLDQAAQDAYSMIKRDPTLTLAEAINNALQAGKVGAVLGGAAEAGKIGLKSLLNSAKFAVPTTEEEEARRAKFEVPAAAEEEVIASPEVQQEEQNIKTAADMVKKAAPVAPQTAAVLAGIAEEKAGELAADVVVKTGDALASVEEEAPLVIDETPLVSPASERAAEGEKEVAIQEPLTRTVTEDTVPLYAKQQAEPNILQTGAQAQPGINREAAPDVTPEVQGRSQAPALGAQDAERVGGAAGSQTTGAGAGPSILDQARQDDIRASADRVWSSLSASSGDGGTLGEAVASLGGRSPQKRRRAGQPSGKLGDSLLEGARQEAQRLADATGYSPRLSEALVKAALVLRGLRDNRQEARLSRALQDLQEPGISGLLPAESQILSDFIVQSPPTTGAVPTKTLPAGQKVTPGGVASPAVEAAPAPAPEAQPEQPDAEWAVLSPTQWASTVGKAVFESRLGKKLTKKQAADFVEATRKGETVHKLSVEDAVTRYRNPVSAVSVDAYGIKLPEGYVKQGELYVYEKTQPLPKDDTAGERGAVAPAPTVEPAPKAQPEQPVSQPVQAFRDAVSQMTPTAQAKWTPELRATAEAYLESGGTTGLQGLSDVQQKVVGRFLPEEVKAAFDAEDARKRAQRNKLPDHRESSLPPTPGKQIRKIGKGAMGSVPVVLDEIAKVIPNIRDLVDVRELREGDPNDEGYYDAETDEIVVLVDNISLRSRHAGNEAAAIRETIIHELLHRGFAKLRQTNPQLFEQFEAYSLADTNDAQFEALVRRGYSMYSNWKDDPAQNQKAREEIFIRKAVVDLNFKGIEAIKSPSSLASQFFSWLRGLLNKLLGRKVDDETLLHWSRVFLNAAQADFIEKTPGERAFSLGRDMLSPDKYARHAELEAKHNAGTITPEETAEAQRMVDEAARDNDYELWFHGNTPSFGAFAGDYMGTHFGDAEAAQARLDQTGQTQGVVRGYYVKLENPVKLKYDPATWYPSEFFGALPKDLQKRMDAEWEVDDSENIIAALKEYGYDGVEYPNAFEGGNSILVFSENAIKSAERFTGVLLEQRFQPTSPDIRYSLADKDAEYLDAVEAGDMEKAQRMVNEAAKAAGFNVSGVGNGITYEAGDEPDSVYGERDNVMSHGGTFGFYFSDNPAVWSDYAKPRRKGEKGRVNRTFLSLKNPFRFSEELISYDAFQKLLRDGGIALPAEVKSRLDRLVAGGFGDTQPVWKWLHPTHVGAGASYGESLKKAFTDAGYDGVIHPDSSLMEGGLDTPATSYVVFSPEQIKSADPVTRDDAGNVIPRSRRFQTVSPDIRYSLGEPPDMQALDKFRETFGTPRQDVGQVLGKKEGSVYTQAQVAPLIEYARSMIGFENDANGDPILSPEATQKALNMVAKINGTPGFASQFNVRAAEVFKGKPVDPEIATAVLTQELQVYANRLSASSPKAEDQILKAALTPFYNTQILGSYLSRRIAGRTLQAASMASGETGDARKSREEAEKAVNKEITKQLGDEALPAAEGMDKAGVEGGVDAIKDDIPAPADPTLRLLDLAVESLDEVAKAKTERVFDILFEIGQLEELVAQDEKVGNKAMSILRSPNLAARNYPTDPAERKALLAQKKAELATALDEASASLQGAKPETRKKVKAKAAKAKSKTDSIQKLIDKLSKMPDESKEAKPKAETLRAAIADAIKEKEFDEQKVRDAATKFGATPEQTERLVEEAERIHEIRQSPKLSKAKLRQFLLSFPKNVLANPEQREALLRSFLTGRKYSEAEINRIVPQVLRDFDTGYQKARKAYLDELEKKLKPKQGQKESKQDQQNRKMLNALRSGLADTTSETSVALAKSLGFEAFRPQDDHILSKLDEEMRKLREQGRLSDSNAKFDAIKSLLIRRRPPRGFGEVVAQSWITSALSSLSNLAVNVWAPMGEAGVRLMSDIVRATALRKFDEIPLYFEAAGKAMKGTLSRFNFAVKTDTFTNSVNTLIAGMASMKDEMQRSAAVLKDKNASPAAKANAGLRYVMSFGDYSRRILSSIDDTWYTALSSYVGSSNLIKLLGDAKMPKKAVEAIVFHANNDALNQARAEYETLQAVEQFIEAMRGKTNEEIDAGFEYLGLNDASVTKEQANYIQELVSAFQSLRLRSGATGDELIKRALKELRNFRASVSVRATELGQMRTKELVREALSDTQTPAQVEEAIKEFDENAKKAASFGMGLHRVEGVPPYDILGNMFGIVDAMGRQAVQKSPLLGRMIVGFFGIPLNLLNRAVWFTPYGLGRYFLAKWQMAKNPEEKFYEYSMSSQRERTMRFTEAAVGTSMTMLLYALGVARDSDDKEDEGFYITLGGPSNKTEYDAWYARGFRKFSICYKTKSGSVVSVPYGRGTGEVLKGPLMLLGAFDDMRLNKKLGDREDMSSVIEYLNAAAAGIGKQATFLGAKNTAGAFFSEQFGTSTVSNLAYSAANLIPFNGLDRSISALALGPPDRSRTGAIWANIPIVRHLAHQPAINVFGDPWGNKSESALNQLWDRQWNQGLIPLNISAPLTGNQKRLYNFIGERLMGPSDPLRGALELRNGYLTDEEFYRYKQYRGKQMTQTWLTDLDRWRKLDDDSLSKAIAELSTKATKKAKDRFNYK